MRSSQLYMARWMNLNERNKGRPAFKSHPAFDELLASPKGKAAVADVSNYAAGGVTFLYTEVED